MALKRAVNLTIRFVDGTESRFAFTREEDLRGSLARIEKALAANVVVLELEDRVVAIPFHNIKSIEVVPPPAILPDYAVTNVRSLS